MVLCLNGLKCGASEKTKSRGLVFYCRRKTQILSFSLVHDKTKDNFLYFTYKFTRLFGNFFSIISAVFVLDGHRHFDLHNIKSWKEREEIGLNFKVLLVSALLSKITTH